MPQEAPRPHHTSHKMRLLDSFVTSLLLSGACVVSAASPWGFEDATVSVQGKGAGAEAGAKHKYVKNPLKTLSVMSNILQSKP
jgi:oligosaccharyltransferase complex subunit delta (ribophorin II)